MKQLTLGKTGITTPQNAFGALPIQRCTKDDAVKLLRRAYDGGMTYFDTARAYTDSEEKLGAAFSESGLRHKIFIATKTAATTAEGFWSDLETSLRNLKTDYVDVYQLHMAAQCYAPGDGSGLYEAMLEAKKQGKIRHIGITAHKIGVAEEIVKSGLYETLQFPFSYLASERDLALERACEQANMGFIAMKALSGGLVTDAVLPFSYIRQFDNVVPIWGFQRMGELEQVLGFSENPPALDADMEARIAKDRSELVGAFCRSCGYCLPCPANIPINNANRMEQLLTRSPYKAWISPMWQEMMERIEDCIHCGVCATRCPYELKPYETLPHQLAFYREFVKAHADEV
ncbi:MAG: aldo/keto reductase [Clostridia bacterium]|nr:aldo/keto reductase [Clostridia bacterium]